jgi:PAS domain S-box-containing protein
MDDSLRRSGVYPVSEVDVSSVSDDPRLRLAVERYEIIMQASLEGWWDWDLTTGFLGFSPGWARQLGYEPEEIASTFDEWRDRVHPDDLPTVLAAIEKHLDPDHEESRYEVDYRIQHRNGQWRWMHSTGRCFRDEHGHAYRFAGSQSDITDRKLAEEALHESQRKLDTLLSSLPGMAYRCANDPNWTMEYVSFGAKELTGYPASDLLNDSPIRFGDLIYPADRDLVWQRIQDALAVRQPFQMTYRMHAADGTTKWVWEQGQGIFDHQDHLLALEGFITDVTDRVRSMELLEQRVAERTRELTLLLSTSRSLVSTLELRPLLDTILDQLGVIVSYDSASVLMLEGDDLSQIVANRHALSEHPMRDYEVRSFSVNWAAEVWTALRGGQPLVIADVRGPGLAAEEYRSVVGERLNTFLQHVTSMICVPLLVKERFIGMFAISHPEHGFYSEHHAELATAMANYAAIAIENARLHEQSRSVAALEERQRLARELHDSVSQALYGIGLGARTARTLLERDPAKVVEPLNYVLQLAEAGLAEMRALIFELRPESLETEGLVAALEKQTAATRARYGIAVAADLPAEPELPLPAKEALYRIAQEAMHNTVKHARASRIELILVVRDGVHLLVRDDGVGFDPDGSFPGHLGLHSMRERIERLGGTLSIESARGSGTTVSALLPGDGPA